MLPKNCQEIINLLLEGRCRPYFKPFSICKFSKCFSCQNRRIHAGLV